MFFSATFKIVFNTLLRENKNSLNARYSNPTDMFRDSYIYRLSNSVVYWIDKKQSGYLVGIVNNYDYQSCEHDNYKNSIQEVIQDIDILVSLAPVKRN